MLIPVLKDILSSVIARAVIVVLVTWWVKWLWSRRRLYALNQKLPGPMALPIFGNIIQMGCLSDHRLIIPEVKGMINKYGGFFRLWFGPVFMVCITEADDYECVLTSKLTYNKGFMYEMLKYTASDGLLVASGSLWKKHRHIMNPSFAISTIRKYQSKHNYYATKMVESMKGVVDKGLVEVSIFPQRYMSDTVCDNLFETQFNFYKGENDLGLKAASKLIILIHERMCKFWLQSNFVYENSPIYAEYAKYFQRYSGLFHPVISKLALDYMAKSDKSKTNVEKAETDHEDLNAHYVLEDNNNVKTRTVMNILSESYMTGEFSMKEVINEFDNVYNAAVDTSYTQLSVFMLMMGMHKRVQDKLWHEIKDFYAHDLDAEVTTDHFPHLPYLEMVIKEGIRHFPTGPMQARRLEEDFYMKSRDITLPAGTQILLVNILLHKNPKHWKNPNEYYPERFSPEESAKRPHFAYIPFSAGLRNCIGQVFAGDALRTAMIHLMRNYEFTADPSLTMDNLPVIADISSRIDKGYHVKISLRDRSL